MYCNGGFHGSLIHKIGETIGSVLADDADWMASRNVFVETVRLWKNV